MHSREITKSKTNIVEDLRKLHRVFVSGVNGFFHVIESIMNILFLPLFFCINFGNMIEKFFNGFYSFFDTIGRKIGIVGDVIDKISLAEKALSPKIEKELKSKAFQDIAQQIQTNEGEYFERRENSSDSILRRRNNKDETEIRDLKDLSSDSNKTNDVHGEKKNEFGEFEKNGEDDEIPISLCSDDSVVNRLSDEFLLFEKEFEEIEEELEKEKNEILDLNIPENSLGKTEKKLYYCFSASCTTPAFSSEREFIIHVHENHPEDEEIFFSSNQRKFLKEIYGDL